MVVLATTVFALPVLSSTAGAASTAVKNLSPIAQARASATVTRPFVNKVAAPKVRQVPIRIPHAAAVAKVPRPAPGAHRTGTPSLPGGPKTTASTDLVFDSSTQANCSCWPPDPNAALSKGYLVSIVNQELRVYAHPAPPAAPTLLKTTTLNSLVGYSTEGVFDPRVIWDPNWNRFVVSAEAFPEPSGAQYQFVAISKTSNPRGAYWVYKINVAPFFPSGTFWDYPQLGQTQDGLVVTANAFEPSAFCGAFLGIPKAKAYNGLGFSFLMWGCVGQTTTPSEVLDGNPTMHMTSYPNGSGITTMQLVHFTNPQDATHQSAFVSGVTVPAYNSPPPANQPGTTIQIETIDSRAVDDGTQIGDSLFTAHTQTDAGLPTPFWREIDTEGAGANTVKQGGEVFESGTSNDWNVSIQANLAKAAIVTWSATDPPNGLKPSVVTAGRKAADAANTMSPRLIVATGDIVTGNPRTSTLMRWGDTSSVWIDPKLPGTAYIMNEYMINPSTWGTKVAHIKIL
jgi:hypothetical protein